MIEGFFDQKQLTSLSRPDGKVYSCITCGLYKGNKHPRMAPFGNFQKEIMIIGEAPGEVEDARGKPWQGKTGQLLQRTLKRLGVDLFEDCVSINACHCRPTDEQGNNRTPTNYEVESCRQETFKIISRYQPKVILLMGGAAVYSVIGHRWKRKLGGIGQWRGWCIPDIDLNTWLCPTFHPSYIQRENSGAAEVIWEQDLSQAIRKITDTLPEYIDPVVMYLDDLSVLDSLNTAESRVVSIDYETTGLKPHAPGHRIVCASVGIDANHAYVFMLPESKRARQPFIRLLQNTSIGKMAHNMKFEESWSRDRLKVSVDRWVWDSMLAAHLLDNRPGVTGLKFQTYVNFGVVDYSSEIDPFLTSTDQKGANATNRILELISSSGGREKLLKYCGLDSVYEYRLAMIQRKLIENQLPF